MESATNSAAAAAAVPPPPPAQQQQTIRRGIVKQVLSGDALVLQGAPVNGPPPETTVYLSNVSAPRLAKRPSETVTGTPDEPWAWEAREFLRKKLVGETVTFVRDFTATSGRDHGRIYLGGTNPENAENIAETGVAEGWLEFRPGKVLDDYQQKLQTLQEAAKAAGKGRWSAGGTGIRQIHWVIENPRDLVDSFHQKPIDAVIEQVRDGSTIRAFLLPNFEYVTLQLSGVKAPGFRGAVGDEFAEEARFFVETRLLQRDVKVVLESTSNQNFVGSVLHPKGNIAESLLREGFAKCVDWSIGLATGGAEKLRAAEKAAKERRLRLWRSYTPATSGLSGDKKSFQAKVIEVVMSDSLVLLKDDGEEQKIFLSSIRMPREAKEDGDSKQPVGRKFLPLYDVPFMFEAREFLRKRLIGKRVQVTVDYIQPKSEQFPEKTCCTVTVGGLNIAEALITKGLSRVVRHRGDDENRSSQYDALLAAEAKAEKSKKGLFADKSADKSNTMRIQELQNDPQRSKQFLPYLQRSTRSEAVVEFISSGSRMRVYVPKETVLVTFLLGGISCPRSAVRAGNNPTQGEPFGEEALKFTRQRVLQHEVEIEVEGLDKSGNFIGYLFVAPSEGARPQNLSELLVAEGLASVHPTAERSAYYNALISAEQRLNIWANWTPEDEKEDEETEAEKAANETGDRNVRWKKVAVTEVHKGTTRFHAQSYEDGEKLEELLKGLRSALANHPPVAGSYTPRKGDLCAAQFSADGQWYRARIEATKGGNADVLYVDYGNRETIPTSKLAALPSGFSAAGAFAREYALALVGVPNAPEYASATDQALQQYLFRFTLERTLRPQFSAPLAEINTEYRVGGTEHVSVQIKIGDKTIDVGRALVEEGFALADRRRDPRLQSLVSEYQEAEKKARRERKNIWEFGDFTGSEL